MVNRFQLNNIVQIFVSLCEVLGLSDGVCLYQICTETFSHLCLQNSLRSVIETVCEHQSEGIYTVYELDFNRAILTCEHVLT